MNDRDREVVKRWFKFVKRVSFGTRLDEVDHDIGGQDEPWAVLGWSRDHLEVSVELYNGVVEEFQ